MLIHNVYFWLEKNLGEAGRKAFMTDLESLRGIEDLEGVFIGEPGPTARPVVDRTYDAALTVLMKDMSVHDFYQAHPLHKQFLENNSKRWSKVVIYDHVQKG